MPSNTDFDPTATGTYRVVPRGPSDSDFARLEDKVDRLTELFGQLLVFEERQQQQAKRLDNIDVHLRTIDQDVKAVSAKLDRWINYGVGAWAVVVTLFALWEKLHGI